ncbi:hypothetical protein L838_4953 [Mycobacterium avium MAV_120709_2344]|nr:hypothetical protein L838_4953 [Mycobacterium avium MAV_120709_2344]ETZ42669.1 hypothetical protein L837_4920 [Mycobacterium avium MAV_061107_1842]
MAGWTRMVAEFGRIFQHPPQCLDRAGAGTHYTYAVSRG